MVRFSRVCRAVVRMSHPQVIRFRQLMRNDGGNTLKSQDNRKGLRTLPLNAMECGFFYFAPLLNVGSRKICDLFWVRLDIMGRNGTQTIHVRRKDRLCLSRRLDVPALWLLSFYAPPFWLWRKYRYN